MATCPDDGGELELDAGGSSVCGRCGGELLSREALGARAPALAEALALETRAESGAFARVRTCPECASPMAPWRLSSLEAWLERCPSCEAYWLDRQDRRTIAMLAARQARAQAYQSLSRAERAEIAHGLAEASSPAELPALHPVHAGLAWLGFPVVTRTEGERLPLATWSLALALLTVFGLGLLHGDPLVGVEGLGFHSASPSALSAVTACFAHFGWLHLLGNGYFLLAFGDGVEQKLSRPVLVGAFVVLGAAAIAIEGALATEDTLIAGASGSVAVLVGACVVLQPRAKVVTRLLVMVVPVPLWVYGALEVGAQGLFLAAGVTGVAWVAHLSGLFMGAALGLAAKRLGFLRAEA